MNGHGPSIASPQRRPRLQVDWILLGLTLVLCGVGLATLYSAAGSPLLDEAPRAFRMQALYMGVGLLGMMALCMVDFRVYERVAYALYGVIIVLLLLVLFLGPVRGGAQRWLPLGPINIQPSELAKLALVLACARYFSGRPREDGWGIKELLLPATLFLLPAAMLIFVEPDLGTALFLGILFAGLSFSVGLRWRTLGTLVLLAALTAPLAYRYILDDYQRERIDVLFSPDADPKGKGYQAIQGRYAIGSGQVLGKGWRNSTQGRLRFLPEQHTDFIFSVYAEEWGFLGSFLLLSLYVALMLWGLWIGWNAKARFGSLLASGIVTILFSHVCINLGGVLGLLPITGVTLPFMSYGGSSVITLLFGVGMLMAVSVQQKSS